MSLRWAGALFELARDKGALDAVARDVEFLGEQAADPAVRAFLFDAGVTPDRKRALVDRLVAHLQPLTANFLRLALERRRLEIVPELREAFRRRLAEQRGEVEGAVESARPLGAHELEALAASLGVVLGRRVLLTNRVVPELVAGVRVLVANRMIDGSAKGRLAGLRTRLMGARLTA